MLLCTPVVKLTIALLVAAMLLGACRDDSSATVRADTDGMPSETAH